MASPRCHRGPAPLPGYHAARSAWPSKPTHYSSTQVRSVFCRIRMAPRYPQRYHTHRASGSAEYSTGVGACARRSHACRCCALRCQRVRWLGSRRERCTLCPCSAHKRGSALSDIVPCVRHGTPRGLVRHRRRAMTRQLTPATASALNARLRHGALRS